MKQFITGYQLEKYHQDQLIFSDFTFNIHSGQKIALIGPNGTGKTTLLKILAQQDQPDFGTIEYANNIHVGYIEQISHFPADLTVIDYMYEAVKEEQKLLVESAQLAAEFNEVDGETEAFIKLAKKYEKLNHEIEQRGIYQLDAKIQMLLTKLGFIEDMWQKNLATLSGGQVVRLKLARLLLTEPDVLLLDEPTNHLDIDTIIWLEQYMLRYEKAIVFITHDQQLLHAVATTIWQIVNNKVYVYKGNYQNFQRYFLEQQDYLEKQEKAIKKEKEKLTIFIEKNKARASTTKRAASAEKKLDKIVDITKIEVKKTLEKVYFPVERASGKEIFLIDNLQVGYSNPLYSPINLDIYRFERVALLGANGIGKTTLLETLFEKIPPLNGRIKKGHHVDIGYFKQEQVFTQQNLSVYETFSEYYPDASREVIYPILARFGFKQDEIQLKNTTLSGGEKQRLLLALLYYQKANTLFLDEPTNHLDIQSKQSLIESLKKFDGTIIFSSHDRNFIKELATKCIYFKDGEVYIYDSYLEFEQSSIVIAGNDVEKNRLNISKIKSDWKDQKEYNKNLKKLEKKILDAEANIEQLELSIATKKELLLSPEVYQDFHKASQIQQEVEQLENALLHAMQMWEKDEEQYQNLIKKG